jgi:hypothetical protein
MRIVLLVIFTIPLLISCSKYQYFTLASNDAPKNQKQQFLGENDTCRITYNFNGQHGPISVSIYNKLSKPLQIDWKRSALIIGDSSASFFEPQVIFNGEVERNRYAINQDFSGTVTQPESIDFIPPQSGITKQSKYIRSKFVKTVGWRQKMRMGGQTIKVSNFTKENSPVAFRIYLTLVSDNNSFNIEHSFYAARLTEAKTRPGQFGMNDGSNFFIKERTGFGQISTVIFSAGLAVLLIAAF